MSKSTKSKTPAAPRAKKTVAPKKATVKKAAAAKKTAAPAKKTATKKVAATKKASAPAKKAVTKKAAVKKTTTKKVAAKKTSAKKAVAKATVISAKIDVGFGNTLFVRGEGPGLSWDAGVPMNSVDADTWSATITGAKTEVSFKFLVNDISWNEGEDYVVAAGSEVTVSPSF